jgi:hypothetical protein
MPRSRVVVPGVPAVTQIANQSNRQLGNAQVTEWGGFVSRFQLQLRNVSELRLTCAVSTGSTVGSAGSTFGLFWDEVYGPSISAPLVVVPASSVGEKDSGWVPVPAAAKALGRVWVTIGGTGSTLTGSISTTVLMLERR